MDSDRPTIAIVDDDASVCRALKRLIHSIGMEAVTFHSGEAYLDMLSRIPSSHASCLILDLQMPKMNGLELQSRLAGRNIPIIFITAHDEMRAREEALRGGAVAFLRKPFDDEVLIATIREALSGTGRAAH